MFLNTLYIVIIIVYIVKDGIMFPIFFSLNWQIHFRESGLVKTTSAVRETSVSRHNQGRIKGPPYTSQYDSTVVVQGFRETLIWAAMMPTDATVFRTLLIAVTHREIFLKSY